MQHKWDAWDDLCKDNNIIDAELINMVMNNLYHCKDNSVYFYHLQYTEQSQFQKHLIFPSGFFVEIILVQFLNLI